MRTNLLLTNAEVSEAVGDWLDKKGVEAKGVRTVSTSYDAFLAVSFKPKTAAVKARMEKNKKTKKTKTKTKTAKGKKAKKTAKNKPREVVWY